MKQVLKPFGRPETDEAKALRLLLESPGGVSMIARVDYVDVNNTILGSRFAQTAPPAGAYGERFILTPAGALEHDAILTRLQEGRIA